MKTPKILFIDIETAPNVVYAWSLFDQNISIDQIVTSGYVLCVSWKWQDGKTEYMRISGNEEESLKRVHQLLDEADFVVHYNGTKFDIPTLHREFLLYGMSPPSPVKEIDLLRTVRKKFKFSSNKLDYVCQRLGLGNKVHHKGMKLWNDCMAGDVGAWKIMEKYNKQDVVLLEKLYNRVLPWITNHPNVTKYSEVVGCPRCGSEKYQSRGVYHTATLSYNRYQCNSCHGWFKEIASLKVDKPAHTGV
jgi:DNA polymerase elongation subunit (family B)